MWNVYIKQKVAVISLIRTSQSSWFKMENGESKCICCWPHGCWLLERGRKCQRRWRNLRRVEWRRCCWREHRALCKLQAHADPIQRHSIISAFSTTAIYNDVSKQLLFSCKSSPWNYCYNASACLCWRIRGSQLECTSLATLTFVSRAQNGGGAGAFIPPPPSKWPVICRIRPTHFHSHQSQFASSSVSVLFHVHIYVYAICAELYPNMANVKFNQHTQWWGWWWWYRSPEFILWIIGCW